MEIRTRTIPNEWADFWRNTIGVNVIPAHSVNKVPKVKWTDWQDKPIPIKLHEQWKKENLFDEGMAIICGKTFHLYKELWLNMIDMDNKIAIKEFCIYDIEKFAQNTLTEQHANKEKAHVYFYTNRPVQNKPPDAKDDSKPMIEVKSQGRFLSYCTPSPHKDGSKYKIIGKQSVKELDPESLELRIEDICKQNGFNYLEKHGSKTLDELRQPSNEGNRNQDMFDYLKEYRKLNNISDTKTLLDIAKERNKINSNPLADQEVEKIVNSNFNYDFDNKTTKDYNENEKRDGKKATEYANEFLEKYHFLTLEETEEILYYQNGIYKDRGEIIIKSLCQQKSDKCSNHIVNEVIGKIQRTNYKSRDDFDSEPNIINLPNGLLDIQTGKITKHSPDKLYRIQIPHNFDSKAGAVNFMKALSQWLPDVKDRITVIEQASNILLRKSGLEIVGMYNGIGSNGKSTYCKFLVEFLGKDNVTSISMQDLVTNRFAPAQLDGKLANIYPDLEDTELEHIGRFKLIVSGDYIQVEKKGKNSYLMSSQAKHTFSTNKIPEIKDDTDSVYRRFQIVDWIQQFRDNPTKKELDDGILPKDTSLLNKLCTEKEFSGFLNLLIVTAKRLQKQGGLTYPQSISEVRKIMKEKADPVKQFSNECLVESIDNEDSKSLIFRIYGEWARQNHEKVIPERKFNAKLKQLLNIESGDGKKRVRDYKNPISIWSGVKIRDEVYLKFVPVVPDVPDFTTGKTKQNRL